MFCWKHSCFHERAIDSALSAVQDGHTFHGISISLWGKIAFIVALKIQSDWWLWIWGCSSQAWENFFATGLDFAGILCHFSSDFLLSYQVLSSSWLRNLKRKELAGYILKYSTYVPDICMYRLRITYLRTMYTLVCYSI